MSDGYTWWWARGSEPERFVGSYATREEALTSALALALAERESDVITLAEAKPNELNDDFIRVDRLLDDWHDHNMDNADEGGYLAMEPTAEQERELEQTLTAAFSAWRAKHGLGCAWALDIKYVETVDIQAIPG